MPDRWILRKNQFCFGSKEFAYPSRLSERKSRLLFFCIFPLLISTCGLSAFIDFVLQARACDAKR